MERLHQFPCKRESYPYGTGTVPNETVPAETGPKYTFVDQCNFLSKREAPISFNLHHKNDNTKISDFP